VDAEWSLGGVRDGVSITADWQLVDGATIAGVAIREVRNVPTGYGHLTELYRQDWGLGIEGVGQVFMSNLAPGRLSAWHAHEITTDRLFVTSGAMLIVLFDGRPDSLTLGTTLAIRSSHLRPQLVTVPPKVWHGIKNVGDVTAAMVNIVDHAYDYEGPDHFRLPPDSPLIPFDIAAAW
jgi:dTDP-4-dehydrorhamnose 3,5-epimerase